MTSPQRHFAKSPLKSASVRPGLVQESSFKSRSTAVLALLTGGSQVLMAGSRPIEDTGELVGWGASRTFIPTITKTSKPLIARHVANERRNWIPSTWVRAELGFTMHKLHLKLSYL